MQFLLRLVDPTLLTAAGGSIAALLLMWVFVRRRRVVAPQGMLVLPHVELAPPRRRLAHGSVGFSGAPVARSRSLRPTHAGTAPRRAL